MGIHCGGCKAEIGEESRYCPLCGKQLFASKSGMNSVGRHILAAQIRCTKCGTGKFVTAALPPTFHITLGGEHGFLP
jgi:hypothetical protein